MKPNFFNILNYDPNTGYLTWIKDMGSNAMAGHVAGSFCRGYIRIQIYGKTYAAHKIAFFLYYSRWPNGFVDHINGNKSDNRISNLREATRSQNAMNQKLRVDSSSGYKGVTFDKRYKKWGARIKKNGVSYYLGSFDSPEKAAMAYNDATIDKYGEFAKLNIINKT